MSAPDCVNGTVCDASQNKQSFSTHANSTILTNGQSIGLAVSILSSTTRITLSRAQLTAEASFLSFGAVIVVSIFIVRNLLRYRKLLPNGDWKLLRTPADIYMLFLFAFDILQAVGGILNVRWAHDGIVTTGPYCTAQGIIKQMGELGVALLSLALTVHTFTIALWSVGAEARSFAFGFVAFTCLFSVLWVSISNGIHKDFETPTPYWCWIGPKYIKERLAGEYVWMWIALFASVVMYILLHFWMKGHLSVDGEKWYKFRLVKSDVEYSERRATLGILFYPLAYTLVVIPLSVSRWLLFNHKKVPSAATFFGIIMFHLSGAVNVLLFLIVRPRLLLFTPPEKLGKFKGTFQPKQQLYSLT
ncbi:hypothetical protein EDB92DRAFT_1954414 [Lactarius akahatsu]|uniref:Glucose receptor Git3 N-terminal domain-containing protein n=1 Tax=Lactarius akahatsu TaxID=416441 RepID=A0AAD4Q867_9AGAM|nr:hypothetical protein EDB92DRAFT_1954414 [Lactarius akahatsu]